MRIFLGIILLFLVTNIFADELYTCADIQSLAIEKECYNPKPDSPDYVYPFRQCYTRVEAALEDFPDPTDAGIREITTKVREQELLRLLKLGELAFKLPDACLPTE